MSFITRLFSHFRRPNPEPASERERLFVFVRVPEALQPREREARYGDPVHEALQAKGFGEVSGGGSQLSAPDEKGQRTIEWCGIDVDLYVHEEGLALLTSELRRLGAPLDTALDVHYKAGIQKLTLGEAVEAGV